MFGRDLASGGTIVAINSIFPNAGMSGSYITLVRYLIWARAHIPCLLTSTEITTRFVNWLERLCRPTC